MKWEHRGMEITITKRGNFVITEGGKDLGLSSENLADAKAKIDNVVATRRAQSQLDTPAVIVNVSAGTVIKGRFRGFHATQRRLLWTHEDGAKDNFEGFDGWLLIRPEELPEELLDLARRREEAVSLAKDLGHQFSSMAKDVATRFKLYTHENRSDLAHEIDAWLRGGGDKS